MVVEVEKELRFGLSLIEARDVEQRKTERD
jgi:hypothetical protein